MADVLHGDLHRLAARTRCGAVRRRAQFASGRDVDGDEVPAEPNNVLQTELRLMGIATEVVRDGETGHEAVTAVHLALDRAVPALLITGDTRPDRIRETRATGIPLLHKPVAPEVLHRRLAAALGLATA